MQDLKSLGSHLCDTLLDFCDPNPAKVGSTHGLNGSTLAAPGAVGGRGDAGSVPQLQRCLAEVDALLRRRLGREPGCGGGWSDVSPSELESRYLPDVPPCGALRCHWGCSRLCPPHSTSGSDSSMSDGPPVHLCGPEQPVSPWVLLVLGWERVGQSPGEV